MSCAEQGSRLKNLPRMGKALIIAEKPSVAGDIARAIGKFE